MLDATAIPEAMRAIKMPAGLALLRTACEKITPAMRASDIRAASDQVWQAGNVLSIDSGGTGHGHIGDLWRMGVVGGKRPYPCRYCPC